MQENIKKLLKNLKSAIRRVNPDLAKQRDKLYNH